MASRGADGVLSNRLRGVVTLAIVLAIATVTISLFVGAVADAGGGGPQTQTQDDLLVSGGSTTLDGTNVSDVGVRQSLNDSAALDGSDSITGPSPSVDDTWTVSTWVRVDNTTGDRLIATQDGARWLVYNATNSEYACWRYDDSAGETHRVSVAAPSPGSFTNIQCSHDGSTLTLRRNSTGAVSSATTDAANATSATLTTDNLDGRLDETRTFNATLTSAQRDQLYNRPTAPLDDPSREARVMYDTHDPDYGGSIPVYIQGATLTESGVAKADGLPGEDPQAGADYSVSGDTVSLLAGGVLDGAPVIFVSWLFGSGGVVSITAVAGPLGAALRLAALVPLALIAKRILGIQLT